MKITKNTLNKIIKEELKFTLSEFGEYPRVKDPEKQLPVDRVYATLNNPEYSREQKNIFHNIMNGIRGSGIQPGGTVGDLGKLIVAVGNNYEDVASGRPVSEDEEENTMLKQVYDAVQDAGGAMLDQEVLKNFLIDVGQYYQPGGSYMVERKMKITKEKLKKIIAEVLQEVYPQAEMESTMSMKVPTQELKRVERSMMGGKYITFTKRQLANIIVSVNGQEHYLAKLLEEYDDTMYPPEDSEGAYSENY